MSCLVPLLKSPWWWRVALITVCLWRPTTRIVRCLMLIRCGALWWVVVGQRIVEVAVHIDSGRDKGNTPARLSLFSGASAGFLSETPDDEIVLPSKFAGWAILRPATGAITTKCLQVRDHTPRFCWNGGKQGGNDVNRRHKIAVVVCEAGAAAPCAALCPCFCRWR